MTSDQTRSTIAAGVAALATLFQCVVGYTSLGSRIGVERTTAISLAGIVVIIIIVIWAATVALVYKTRLMIGISATLVAAVLGVVLLWLTYNVHSIVITQQRAADFTVTDIRSALTKTDVSITLATPSNDIVLRAIDMHDVVGKAARLEHTSDSEFFLDDFQYPQKVTLVHTSSAPLQPLVDTDNSVSFTTPDKIRQHVKVTALVGGILWLIASSVICLLVWSQWRARKPKPAVGFHTRAESSTPLQENPSAKS